MSYFVTQVIGKIRQDLVSKLRDTALVAVIPRKYLAGSIEMGRAGVLPTANGELVLR